MLARHFGAPGLEVDKAHLRVLVQVGGGGRQGDGGSARSPVERELCQVTGFCNHLHMRCSGCAALACFGRFQRLAQLRWSNCWSLVRGLGLHRAVRLLRAQHFCSVLC